MCLFGPDQRKRLLDAAENADRLMAWPESSWSVLNESGVTARSIPAEFGGAGLGPVQLREGMEEIARSCLTTAFILSQREAAVRHLLRGPAHLRSRYLPQLAAGKTYATVGLSQLTTSRQHLGPALRATSLERGGFQLDGEIPWVTGADQAAVVVAGATLPDGSQILVALEREQLVGSIEAPLELAAVAGSRTSLIQCRGLKIESDQLLAGPTQGVLGKLGGGGLDTSCLAIGLASAATDFIREESKLRADLSIIADRFESAIGHSRQRLHSMAEATAEPCETLDLRTDCTRLTLRATQAALMIAKGHGFVAPHPTQRWARQATFFLVWSCPRPVAEGVLTDLSDWSRF